MLCEEFEDRLNAVLDERGKFDGDPELRLHCELCPDCRHIASVYSALLDGFAALPMPHPPSDVAARVLAELPARTPGVRRVALGTAALAVAAGLLVAVAPLLRIAPHESRQMASRTVPQELAVDKPTEMATQPAALESPSVETLTILQSLPILSGEDDSDVYGELIKETGSGLASIVRYVPGVGGTRGIIDAESNPDANEAPWAVQMSAGLRPVTDSVTDTLQLLWQRLPMAELASRS